MEKLFYWLKKLGIYRSASYKVKGDASKLAEMHAKDGGMIQSQEEIDEEYEKKTGKKVSPKSEKRKTRVLFWIFTILALFFLLGFLSSGFSLKAFVVMVAWIGFLVCVWRGKKGWTTSLVKVLVFGLVVTMFSLLFFDSPKDENSQNSNSSEDVSVDAEKSSSEKCDDSNSQHADFNKVEKVIVSKNPCKVPWLLAKEFEKYTLKTKKGTTLQAIVWNNYINNVKAGESYTIRVLDVADDPTGRTEVKAGVAIIRWVKNKAALPEAKKEVEAVVQELDY